MLYVCTIISKSCRAHHPLTCASYCILLAHCRMWQIASRALPRQTLPALAARYAVLHAIQSPLPCGEVVHVAMYACFACYRSEG